MLPQWALSAYGNPTRVDLPGDFMSEAVLAEAIKQLADTGGPIFVEDLEDWQACQFEIYTEDLGEGNDGYKKPLGDSTLIGWKMW